MNTHTLKNRKNFFDSEEGVTLRAKLQNMATDTTFHTLATYTSDAELYPDNLIPFVDKHMNYLYSHPALDGPTYLTNLRLMTRVK